MNAFESPPAPALDLALVRKYCVAGPRYTSYPPATRFTAGPADIDLEAALAEDNASD